MSPACERFETEGLERMEAGEPLDGHFATCADCLASRRTYEAVIRAIEQARLRFEPAGEWEAKVWARVDQIAPPRRRVRWLVFLSGAAAGFALAVALALAFAALRG